MNGLSTESLVHNLLFGTPETMTALIRSPLTTATFDRVSGHPQLRQALDHWGTRDVMKYLVGCALSTSDVISYTGQFGESYTFTGSLDLCPEWRTKRASKECQEKVTACLLAENNAKNMAVPLSFRGQPGGEPLLLGNRVRTVQTHPYKYVGEIGSYRPCGAVRGNVDCGWGSPGFETYAYSCHAGEQIEVGAGAGTNCASPLGTSTGDVVMRVCSGVRGCDAESSDVLTNLGYSDDVCGRAPAHVFECPFGGTFSVMLAPYLRGEAASATIAARTVAKPSWPSRPITHATELQAFRLIEGATYGNIFLNPEQNLRVRVTPVPSPQGLGISVSLAPGVPPPVNGPLVAFGAAWACFDPMTGTEAANVLGRICTQPTPEGTCAAAVAGPCRMPPGSPTTGVGAAVCAAADGPLVVGDNDFVRCRDGAGRTWGEPLTVALSSDLDFYLLSGIPLTPSRWRAW